MEFKAFWTLSFLVLLASPLPSIPGDHAAREVPTMVPPALCYVLGVFSLSERSRGGGGTRRSEALPPVGIKGDLVHSGEFLRTVLDNMNDSLSIIDVSTFRIVGVNRVFLEQYGLQEQDVIDRTCYGVTHHRQEPCCPPHDTCPLKETLETGRHASAEHVHYLPDGAKVFVEVSTSPIRDGAGRIVQVVHLARDISDRKLAEEALRKYAGELGQANRIRELFTDIIGHELLSQISAIKNYAHMLGSGDPARSIELASAIGHIAEKIEEMLRNVSKYDGYRKMNRLEMSELDLVDILSPLVEMCRGEAEAKGISIALGYSGEAPLITSPLVAEVFSNILSNALKYAPGGTAIEVDLSEEPESWVFSCSDGGEGVPDECKKSIFERFVTFDKKGVKGIGLGLAISRLIVELAGGSIWVEDKQGGGSVFRVRLPKRPKRTTST